MVCLPARAPSVALGIGPWGPGREGAGRAGAGDRARPIGAGPVGAGAIGAGPVGAGPVGQVAVLDRPQWRAAFGHLDVLQRDHGVDAVPAHAGAHLGPRMRLLVGGRRVRRPAAVGVTAPQHATAAARIELHGVAVAFVEDADVATVARTGEVSAAHTLDAQLEPQLRAHITPERVARLPDVLVGQGHRFADGVLAEALGDLGLDLLDPDHEAVVLRGPAHAHELDRCQRRLRLVGRKGRPRPLQVAGTRVEATEASEQLVSHLRLARASSRQPVVEDVGQPGEEDLVHDRDLVGEVLGQLEGERPLPLVHGDLDPGLGTDAEGRKAILAQRAVKDLAVTDRAVRPALGTDARCVHRGLLLTGRLAAGERTGLAWLIGGRAWTAVVPAGGWKARA